MVNPVLPFYAEKKYPSYLKGLVNTHARALGDVGRLTELLTAVQAELVRVEAEAQSTALLIRKFDNRLDPTRIAPVRAQRGRFGEHGGLQEALRDELRKAYPQDVSTTQLAWTLVLKFKVDFPTWRERKTWVRNTVAGRLRKLVASGEVERLHDAEMHDGSPGRWRWVDLDGPPGSVEGMAAAAAAAGVEVDDEEVRAAES